MNSDAYISTPQQYRCTIRRNSSGYDQPPTGSQAALQPMAPPQVAKQNSKYDRKNSDGKKCRHTEQTQTLIKSQNYGFAFPSKISRHGNTIMWLAIKLGDDRPAKFPI